MRCEPPMPAQFIRTRAIPCAASALASPATFSAFSLLWSSTAIFAPLAAMARAVAAPRPEPPPVMRTATSFNCIVKTFPWAVVLREWRIASGRKQASCFELLPPYSLLAIHYSLFSCQHAAANQRFHVPDVLAADLVGDRPDAGRARHRAAAEKQVVAGADQAGVEQHRIDVAELARFYAFREQAAVEAQQRRDKEF